MISETFLYFLLYYIIGFAYLCFWEPRVRHMREPAPEKDSAYAFGVAIGMVIIMTIWPPLLFWDMLCGLRWMVSKLSKS